MDADVLLKLVGILMDRIEELESDLRAEKEERKSAAKRFTASREAHKIEVERLKERLQPYLDGKTRAE